MGMNNIPKVRRLPIHDKSLLLLRLLWVVLFWGGGGGSSVVFADEVPVAVGFCGEEKRTFGALKWLLTSVG
jgi:hypothetical protein